MSKKIAVMRALKLGDMLCFIPTLKALRSIHQNAVIHLICHSSQIPLMKRYPDLVDELIPFPGFPGMPEQNFKAEETMYFFSRMQQEKYDVAFQLHGSGEISNLVVQMFGAKTCYGFFRPGHHCPDARTFYPYPEHLPEALRGLYLVQKIQTGEYETKAHFPLTRSDFEELFNSFGRPARPYFCVHPGASSESKRWSKKGFALVADYLNELGFDVVFTGSRMESELVREVSSLMRRAAYDSATLDLPLGPLSALISESEGLICNDTGVSHLASLLQKKSVVIFSETDPARWAPLNKELHHSLLRPSVHEVIQKINQLFVEQNNLELT